jgi:hypothetical protein
MRFFKIIRFTVLSLNVSVATTTAFKLARALSFADCGKRLTGLRCPTAAF